MIRSARSQDLDALVAIETAAFDIDRFSRRSFRYLLTRANAQTCVYEDDAGRVLGYTMVLFHTGTSLARMYSLAVHPDARGRGLGGELIEAAEQVALEHGCISLRLEVRRDNPRAISLYESMGYRLFGTKKDYYEDHMEALRYEKRLVPQLKAELAKVPYYRQTLDFTCGPSALMMAMKALRPEMELSRHMELRLWRESTTIFMTSGHGGCGPYGLALAAYHLGFDVELYVSEHEVMFINSVRSEEKKEVMRLVQEDFQAELAGLPLPIHEQPLTMRDMERAFRDGGIPIVLISSYRIYQEKFPHWVVVTGFDEQYVYAHDPFVDYDKGKVALDSINMPIPRKDFEHMARYGKAAQKAALIIRKRNKGKR
jgi:ribosomal protein S18 acetylase RimI-like enzyme